MVLGDVGVGRVWNVREAEGRAADVDELDGPGQREIVAAPEDRERDTPLSRERRERSGG